MTNRVLDDDPRRHIRIRLRAAQLLVHALWAGLWPEGMRLAIEEAIAEIGQTVADELLPVVLSLIHEFIDEPLAMTRRLRVEIVYLTACLEDVTSA